MKMNRKDLILTYGNPACRLCEYSGYARICSLEEQDKCPQVEFIKQLHASSSAKQSLVTNKSKKFVSGEYVFDQQREKATTDKTTQIVLAIRIPEAIFTKFEHQGAVRSLLQDFVEADGVVYLQDVLEELLEETPTEDKEKMKPFNTWPAETAGC